MSQILDQVDTIFADVAQPDQSRIVAVNADYFLKPEGYAVISLKASCIDSTAEPESAFLSEVTHFHWSLQWQIIVDYRKTLFPNWSSNPSPGCPWSRTKGITKFWWRNTCRNCCIVTISDLYFFISGHIPLENRKSLYL